MLKTYTTHPLVRPFSTARSLGFLIKNTLADFATQTLISMVRLPEATKTPVPPLAGGATSSGPPAQEIVSVNENRHVSNQPGRITP